MGRQKYEFRGEWHAADVRQEEIKVKDADPVIEEVVITRHGPIINSLIEGEGMETASGPALDRPGESQHFPDTA